MANLVTSWTPEELLADEPGLTPLIVNGRRGHGGFDAAGKYRSPRTRFRTAAIEAWQANHAETFGTDLFDAGLDTWPPPSPNVAQSRFLLERGVRDPIITALTRIGTVEGFGGAMRMWAIEDVQRHFVEPIADTTLDHLPAMFEAQARDEAGWGDEAGHRDLWFAARDIAFESPPVEDLTELMLFRLGVTSAPGAAPPSPDDVRRRQESLRVFPNIDLEIEGLIVRMIGLLLIEISAAHLFAWAEELLADPDLVAGEGVAAQVVSFIRQDETPHIEYLRTALSEMRDRTFVATEGRAVPGVDVVPVLWARGLAESTGARRETNLRLARQELEDSIASRPDRVEILERYDTLGPPSRPIG